MECMIGRSPLPPMKGRTIWHSCLTWDSNSVPLVLQPVPLTTTSFCIASNVSCSFAIDTRVFTAHSWLCGEWQHHQIVYQNISRCLFYDWVSVAKWLAHFVSVPLLRIGDRIRFPCSPGRCGVNVNYINPIICSINWNLA